MKNETNNSREVPLDVKFGHGNFCFFWFLVGKLSGFVSHVVIWMFVEDNICDD